jgi:hypothetical protein
VPSERSRHVDGEVDALCRPDPALLPVVVEAKLCTFRQDIPKPSEQDPKLIERDFHRRTPATRVGRRKV